MRLVDADALATKLRHMGYMDENEEVQEVIDRFAEERDGDRISRQAAIDALERIFDRCEEIEAHLPEGDPDRTGYRMYPDFLTVWKYLHQLTSAAPNTDEEIQKMQDMEQAQLEKAFELGKEDAKAEITDEQAIEHLQATGWMQNHDREMYESGLRERLADDSGSYDSIIPESNNGDYISRQAAIAELNEIAEMKNAILDSLNISDRRARDMIEAELGQINDDIDSIKNMPSAQPEQKTGKWIIRTRHEHFPSGKEYTELVCPFCGRTDHNGDGDYCGYCGAKMEGEQDNETI